MPRAEKTRPKHAARHPVRARLLELVRSRPGLSVRELCGFFSCHRGTVQYHLYVLRRCSLVLEIRDGRTTRYFEEGTTGPLVESLRLLRTPRVREIMQHVLKLPGTRQRDLTRGIAMSRKVFRHYANILVDRGLLDEQRVNAGCSYFPTQRLMSISQVVLAPDFTSLAGGLLNEPPIQA